MKTPPKALDELERLAADRARARAAISEAEAALAAAESQVEERQRRLAIAREALHLAEEGITKAARQHLNVLGGREA